MEPALGKGKARTILSLAHDNGGAGASIFLKIARQWFFLNMVLLNMVLLKLVLLIVGGYPLVDDPLVVYPLVGNRLLAPGLNSCKFSKEFPFGNPSCGKSGKIR